jgi:ferrous iron transport protein A
MADRNISPSRSVSFEIHKDTYMTLCDIPVGNRMIVSQLNGGKEFINRVASLGITIGTEVTVLQNQGHGPIIVSIISSHVALGRHEAELIQVQSQ